MTIQISLRDIFIHSSPFQSLSKISQSTDSYCRCFLLGKTSIRKKIAKYALSPLTTLRTRSERENTIDARPKKLLDMDPSYLAQELCLIDKELLLIIPWSELSVCGWMTKKKYQVSPNVMAMVEFFNRIALLVASQILCEDDVKRRVRVISKVIKVANKLRAMGNFNSLKAVLGGLQCTPIYRLDDTWKELSSKRRKQYRSLTNLMSEEDNFAAYRNELDNLMDKNVPCLPFLGDFLTQIAQTQTYLACRKKECHKSTSKENKSENLEIQTTSSPQNIQTKSLRKKSLSRTSWLKKRSFSVKEKYDRFSQSSPNISGTCRQTPGRLGHYRSHSLRKSQSWQNSSDSGIQVDESNTSCFSSGSFLTSDTSLGYETGEEGFESSVQKNRGVFSATSTPIPGKGSLKCSNPGGKSKHQSLSRTQSILSSVEVEDAKKSPDVKDARNIPDQESSDKTGPELQLGRFHSAAMQYSFQSRPCIHHFLTSTAFNAEEENYQLSVKREPLAKKSVRI
ncbi:ras-specific guanine nucleotide-releasing factor RalGPS1-like [Dendronephthya gigantea]|uniref:ras-specific guanine nucleotide-releasing factor RalGPS1-like n=1 Tax=Dendronephthya gigantea TaxID=151771 RepID=UPI00106AC7D5|nr:ras-specific guanine nucleotide-releasing factor RalGPS1-like [Dendronephthya gigantea]